MNMHAIDAVEYITVIPTLFGYGTMRYDAEDGSPSEYGRVDYPTESEALAEAQGWAIADDIPLDKHAMRLARSMLAATHSTHAAPETVAGLMAEVREAVQSVDFDASMDGRELKELLSASAPMRVSACITSDRRTVDAKFDASHWLAAATDEAIETLAAADWSGESADALAYFEEGRGDDSVIAVLAWCGKSMDLPQDMQEGFTVTVNESEAMAWLERHRPMVKAAIDAMPSSNHGCGAASSVGMSP